MRRLMRYLFILFVIAVAGGFIVRRLLRAPVIKPGSYLLLEVGGSYSEGPPPDLVASLLRRRERTLNELITTIREAQIDQRIKGVIVKVTPLEIGWGKIQDIRDALLEFKGSHKPLLALLQAEASGSNKEYYLASTADRVYLSPSVTAPLNGLAANFIFLGGVWEKLDIQMDVEKIREYKTFGDMLANKEMTPAHRDMANSLLDSLNAQFIGGIMRNRGLTADAVRALIDKCPVSPTDYETAHLSDGSRYLQDLHDEIGGEQTPLVDMKDYEQVDAASLGLGVGPKIGVVYAVGGIMTGESGTGIQGEMMGSDTVSHALMDAADDDAVRAIVFRVDSPGGSALASDLVWRATQQARKKKPVIVSMSDVAASGGYYVSAGGSRILAQPGTLTGSIGVVFARANIKGLLARLGINTETITRGPFANLEDVTTPLTPDGRQKLIMEMDHIYDIFVDRVAAGRSLTAERVNAIGRGRVWTGAQAKENGLVDELGGFAAATQAAKKAAGIDPKQEVELVYYPRRKSVLERLSEALGSGKSTDLPAAWQQVLRAAAVPFEDGSLLTLMPQAVDVR
ncbi:MAG TPA: signal peptide peptidase SppA [Candidatus Margulisiibacteriota bacterium]|nr:signal peptide peptidase SppA [Candidatus Margulisiibacteriota bacterium]